MRRVADKSVRKITKKPFQPLAVMSGDADIEIQRIPEALLETDGSAPRLSVEGAHCTALD
jgi:hypothetical protein